jgi:hypothetical protein
VAFTLVNVPVVISLIKCTITVLVHIFYDLIERTIAEQSDLNFLLIKGCKGILILQTLNIKLKTFRNQKIERELG